MIGNIEVDTDNRGWADAMAEMEGQGLGRDLKPSEDAAEPGYYYFVVAMDYV